MSQRLTRKEIKRDEVLETVGSAVDYLRQHARKILYLAVAVVVAVVAAFAVQGYQNVRSARSNEHLAEALRVLRAPVDAIAPQPEDRTSPVFATEESRDLRARELFERVRSDLGSTRAAAVAGVYLGEMAARKGRLDEARELWEAFVDAGSDDMLSAQVRVNLMELDRRQGRGEELVDRLRAGLEGSDAQLPEEVVLHQLALTLESLDRPDEALEAYERLVGEFPRSPYEAGARQRLDVLGG